jgi:uncharacterized protein (DUF1778 family)
MRKESEERIDLRLPEAVKEQIRKSAALTGRSMSDFIVAAAIAQAEATMASIERWEVNETDSRFIMGLLLAPPAKVPALRKLLSGIRTKKTKKRRKSASAA